MESHYARSSIESTEHQDDPSVVTEVRHRLDPTPRLIEVRDLVGVKDGELLPVALWGAVDMAVTVKCRSRDEEDRLILEPASQAFVDAVMDSSDPMRVLPASGRRATAGSR
jgi:hypothetical protein